MTEQEFRSRSYKYMQVIDYVHPRTKNRVTCSLLAVNFDHGTFWLSSIPYETETHFIDQEEFWCSYEYVFPTKFKMTAIK
jgi:hypothetical protein